MKAYSDLGKDAKDLLNKDYVLGVAQFTHKGKIEGIEINTSGKMQHKSDQTSSNVEAKFKFPKYGLTIAEAWDSKNILKTDVCVENYFYKGLKQNVLFGYNVASGATDLSIKNAYKHKAFNLALHVNSPHAARNVTKSLVIGSNGYLAGADLSLDGNQMKVSNLNLALGYEVKDLGLFCHADNFAKLFRASLHQKVNDRLSGAAQVSWKREQNTFNWCAGVSYVLDDDRLHTLKAKVDDSKNLTLSMISQLSDAVKVQASTCLGQSTQVGFGVSIET